MSELFPDDHRWVDNEESNQTPTLIELLTVAGFDALTTESEIESIHAAITKAYLSIKKRDSMFIALARGEIIKRLKSIKLQGVTGVVDAVFKTKKIEDDTNGTPLLFVETEPWSEEVDGAALLHDMAAVFREYLILPDRADVAMSLWVVHAWCFDAFNVSPFLFFSSPEKRCGKSSALAVLRNLVPSPLSTGNASPAAIFRSIQEFAPTLLIDEADTFLKLNDELNGILNAGHAKSGAFVLRTEGESFKPVCFSVWCPKIVAGIGRQKGTLEDRAIIISMKRKAQGERVARMRADRLSDELESLRMKCRRWVADNFDALKDADPRTPETLNDRAADNWRPLTAIADLAGGDWAELARSAALTLSGNSETESDSYGVQLLTDIQRYFQEEKTDKVQTDVLVKHLTALEDRPWVELKHGKPITPTGLSRLLKKYGIKPRQFWDGAKERGYLLVDFNETFSRYLPIPRFESVDTVEPFKHNDLEDFRAGRKSEILPTQKQRNSLNNSDPTGPTDSNTGNGEKKEMASLFEEYQP